MNVCALCGHEVEVDKYFNAKSTCAGCGGDLRICLNCRFYSESSHNKCLETQAEFQRTRDRATLCDYFSYGEGGASRGGGGGGGGKEDKDSVRRALDDLFN